MRSAQGLELDLDVLVGRRGEPSTGLRVRSVARTPAREGPVVGDAASAWDLR